MIHRSNSRKESGSTRTAGARRQFLLILYLILVAGLFGEILLHRIMWATRCQDAINMSHTASALARTYTSMDVTKTVEFKASFNRTITRVLDNKLPVLILRTCVSALHVGEISNRH